MEHPPTIPDLVESLRLSFQKSDFARAEALLLDMDAERQRLRSDLALRTTAEERCSELESRYEAMESWKEATTEELEVARRTLEEIEVKVGGYEEEKAVWGRSEEMHKERILELEEDVRRKEAWGDKVVELEAAKRELEVANVAADEEVAAWKRKCEELEMVVKCLEEEGLEMKSRLSGKEEEIRRLESELCEGRRDGSAPRLTKFELSFGGKVGEEVNGKGTETSHEDSVEIIDRVKSVGDGVVVIVDSEDDDDVVDCSRGYDGVREIGGVGNGGDGKRLEMLDLGYADERVGEEDEDTVARRDPLAIPTPKRKRASRVVVSDSEGEEDDTLPIAKVTRKRIMELSKRDEGNTSPSVNDSPNYSTGGGDNGYELTTPSKRRLVPLHQCQGAKSGGKGTPARSSIDENVTLQNSRRKLKFPASGIAEEDDTCRDKDVEDATSESEGDSLGGFIVHDSVHSEIESTQNDVFDGVNGKSISDDESGDTGARSDASEESDSDPDMKKLLARISREKKSAAGWKYEADMLSSFSKDPEICMKAVCALYRQQTDEEQSLKETINLNGRGFNKLDATRASRIAEFLLDGNPCGPVNRSVEDLEKYDSGGIGFCNKIASRYSKQLFSIYQNREDPFFCHFT